MRLLRVFSALVSISSLAGCGYIHFGRLPTTAAGGDTVTAEAYSNLLTEHKILKQELVLARQEGDALRAAVDRGAGSAAPEVVTRLNETTQELAALRASYAKLQGERNAPAASSAAADVSAASAAQLSALEEKLAVSLHNYTQLQAENAQLRADLDRTRAENSTLAEQLKTAGAQNEQTQATLAQLNTELLAAKEARARAEQATAAAQAQLTAVMARPPAGQVAPLEAGRAASAPDVAARPAPAAPPAGAPATAELSTSPDRIQSSTTSAPDAPPAARPAGAAAPDARPVRIHVVEAGETLETIAQKYYGTAEHWTRIYAANNELLRGGVPLKPGMKLEIPE